MQCGVRSESRRTTAGWPQETCKSPKDAIGNLENLNCTEINKPLDVYTRRTRTHPAMQHFLITLCTLLFTLAFFQISAVLVAASLRQTTPGNQM